MDTLWVHKGREWQFRWPLVFCAAAATVLELSAEACGELGSPLFPQREHLFPFYHKGSFLQSLTLAASCLPYNMHIALLPKERQLRFSVFPASFKSIPPICE